VFTGGLSCDAKSFHRKKKERTFLKSEKNVFAKGNISCLDNESMRWYLYILNLAGKHTLNKLDLRGFPLISMKS